MTTLPGQDDSGSGLAKASQVLAPKADFKDINLATWHKTDKAGILLSAPAALYVLGDMLVTATAADFELAKGYDLIGPGSSFKTVVIKVVGLCWKVLENSCTEMKAIKIASRSIVVSAKSILRLLGDLTSHEPNPRILAALHNQLDSIQEQVQTTTNSSLAMRDGFDSMLDLIMQLRMSLVAAQSNQDKLRETLKIKDRVAKTREEGLREIKEREFKHLEVIEGLYEQALKRKEKAAERIPKPSEVADINNLEIGLYTVSVGSGLAMAYFGRSPDALLETWDTAQSLFEKDPKTQDPDLPTTKPFNRERVVKKLGVEVATRLYSLRLTWVVTLGPDNGVDWKNVTKETQELRAAFGLELDLLGNEEEGKELDHPDDDSSAAGSKETAPPNTSPKENSVPNPNKAQGGTPGDMFNENVKVLLREGIELCNELYNLQLLKDPERVETLRKKIWDFHKRVTKPAVETVLESHQTPSPIGPSSGATGTPSDGKDPKKESDEKGKPKELVGDKAKRLAEYNLKVARVQLESTREIYLASVDDASSAVVKLGEIVGQLAKLDVRKRQADDVMASMAKPLVLMGDVETAFFGIQSLFSSVDNTVKVTLRSALEIMKQKVELRLDGSPNALLQLNQHARHVIADQVISAAKVARMVQDATTLYTTMFDDCIKDGLVTILGMQDLITADITVDGGKIDERRKGLLAWAGEAQTKMATILKQDQDDFLAQIEARMKELSAVNLHIEVNPEVEKAIEDAKVGHVEPSAAVLAARTRRRQRAWAMVDQD